MWWPTAIWEWQLFGVLVLGIVAHVAERNAAMRGCQRQPLPSWLDRALRVAFLGVVAGPTCLSIDRSHSWYPLCTPLLVLYMIPYTDLCEQRGGWTNLYARRSSLVGWLQKYLDVQVFKTVDLDPKGTYIFGVHPHGILPFGAMVGMNYEGKSSATFHSLFPGIKFRTLAATFCFYVPGYRELLLASGVVDAARYSAKQILSLGFSLALVPGGATEALHNYEDHDVVYLRKRHGFVKLALESGASLVPCFSFNECNTYGVLGVTSPTVTAARRKFQSIFGISLPLVTNVFPRKTQIRLVIGRPIKCPKIDDPDRDTVQKYLDMYADELCRLYDENKDTHNVVEKPSLTVI